MSAETRPKYQQLCDQLVGRIEGGEWEPGSKLPSEVVIAKDYGVAYMTVRQAVSALVESGHLRRIRGRGTFVVEPEQPGLQPVLGFLLPPQWHSLDPFYFPQIVSGFTTSAQKLGYEVQITDRTEPLLEFIKLRELRISAVACILIDLADTLEVETLIDRGVVVIAVNHYLGTRRIPSVAPDNRQGAFDATQRLLELGHRRIVFFAGPEGNVDAVERTRGFRDALREAGIPLRPSMVLPGFFWEKSGYDRAMEVMARTQKPTAILAASDLAAIGAMRALYEMGQKVPDDVSVVGFGDFRPAAYLCPSLASVRMPLHELGEAAAQLLVDTLKGYRSESVRLECPFQARESIGPARH